MSLNLLLLSACHQPWKEACLPQCVGPCRGSSVCPWCLFLGVSLSFQSVGGITELLLYIKNKIFSPTCLFYLFHKLCLQLKRFMYYFYEHRGTAGEHGCLSASRNWGRKNITFPSEALQCNMLWVVWFADITITSWVQWESCAEFSTQRMLAYHVETLGRFKLA